MYTVYDFTSLPAVTTVNFASFTDGEFGDAHIASSGLGVKGNGVNGPPAPLTCYTVEHVRQ